MTTNEHRFSAAALVASSGALLLVALAGCAAGTTQTASPQVARAEALRFLHHTEQIVDVQWPNTPDPVAERCNGGVRFAYTVVVTADNDAQANAEAFADFWTSEGLSVSSTETDFGSEGNRLYSATAERDSGPRAAYQLSATSLAVEVRSGCAEGSIDDYDE